MTKIAVIGMSCLFPGATSPEEFFAKLLDRFDGTSQAGFDQMQAPPAAFLGSKGDKDKYYNLRGGYIRGFTFDPQGYRLPPEALQGLDEVYQWPLHTAREALSQAGYLNHPSLGRCGLVLGNLSFPTRGSNRHFLPHYQAKVEELASQALGQSISLGETPPPGSPQNLFISGRPAQIAAQALGLGGLHFALDGACASSIYAVKFACDQLQSGQADLMLAGAVSAADPFFVSMGFSVFQALPAGERSFPLDARSQGLVAAEGAGFFLLKRLADARRDGDVIHAVIKGIGLSNDGRGKFILSPNHAGQVLAFERAYGPGDAEQVGYVECHATGTPLGDVTELKSLDQFFGPGANRPLVGSVKSNFGHMLTAAGMGSMMKVILSLQKGVIPPTIHVEQPLASPHQVIQPQQIVTQPTPWPNGKPLGAVSAFGFGGANAHLVFEPVATAQDSPSLPLAPMDLAVVGLEAAAAQAPDQQAFGQAVLRGQQPRPLAPPDARRWLGLGQPQPAGAMEGFEFDYFRFKIPPNPQDPLITQQLLLLKTADAAIRDAGLAEGSNVAVLVAMETEPELHRFRARIEAGWKLETALQGLAVPPAEAAALKAALQEGLLNPVGMNQFTSFIGNLMAGRVASLWDFKGPAVTISSEGASLAKAIVQAHLLLERGEVEAVVIGAVDLAAGFEASLLAQAQGISVTADGACALVLQRLPEAVRQNRVIYGRITGCGPDLAPEGQYQETATPVGNPAWTSDLTAQMGHAGAAQLGLRLCKALLAIHEKTLPPGPGAAALPQPWLEFQGRQAWVGEGGWGIQLAEAEERVARPVAGVQEPPYLFWLRQPDLLAGLAKLEAQAGQPLFALAKSCWETARMSQGPSLALLAANADELQQEIAQLRKAISQQQAVVTPKGSCYQPQPIGGKLAFVYPGGFNSYPGMLRDLLRLFPELWALPASYTRDPLRLFHPELVFGGQGSEQEQQQAMLANPVAMFETGINASILYTGLLRGLLQLQPDLAFGYSMGEVSLGFALGAWPSTDEMSDYLAREPVFQTRLAGPLEVLQQAWGTPTPDWKGLAVKARPEQVQPLLEGEPLLRLLIINSPQEVVLAGQGAALQAFVAKQGWEHRPVFLADVIHCDWVQPEYASLKALHSTDVPHPPSVTLLSANGYGVTPVNREQLATNIAEMYIKPLDFPRLVNQAYDLGARIFIELGPRSTTSKLINQILGDKPHLAVGVNHKGQPDQVALFRALSQLLAQGVTPNLTAVFGPDRAMAETRKGLPQKVSLAAPGFGPLPQVTPLRPQPAPVAAGLPPRSTPQRAGGQPVNLGDLLAFHGSLQQLHRSFLEARRWGLQEMAARLSLNQARELQGLAPRQPLASRPMPQRVPGRMAYPPVPHPGPKPKAIWDEAALMEFACGSIAQVFGPDYAVIDSYGPRVRLPMPPYLLANRVTQINARRGEFKPSSITTEYDVPHQAWYSVDGQIPWAIAVEAGQCDLLLISYLGIDFEAQGEYLYRLLDCTLTFKGNMPQEGDRMRYEIRINSFARQGRNLLFFFEYDCYVGQELVHTMTEGCAGFYNAADLAGSAGFKYTAKELAARRQVQKQAFTPWMRPQKRQFSQEDLLCLCRGQVAQCFGPGFAQAGRNLGLRFSSEEFLMLDEVTQVEVQGGPWGLGLVKATKHLSPDDWHFTCHFKDDPCLAGSLMAEGCVQLLEFYLLHIGAQSLTQNARFRPLRDLPNKVRCRGQVVPGDSAIHYRLEVKEIGIHPHPYAKADVDILLGDKVVVNFQDVGIELADSYLGGRVPAGHIPPKPPRQLAYDDAAIDQFARGSIAQAFGPEFKVLEGRIHQRNPNGALQLVSRVPLFQGQRGQFGKTSYLETEYDLEANPWVFDLPPAGVIPYAVIMEIALQPCGVLGAVMGSPLLFPAVELCFRNLDGQAQLLHLPNLRGQTVTAKVWLDLTAPASNTIVQRYRFELWSQGEKFYQGKTTFGYFTPQAFLTQKGMDQGEKVPPWLVRQGLQGSSYDLADEANCPLFQSPGALRLATGWLNLLDRVEILPQGGLQGLGYVYGFKKVNPQDWFYPCHFFEDSVMPGSLGVEAILQAIKAFALDQNMGQGFVRPHFTHPLAGAEWKYSGQIIPSNDNMELEAHITQVVRQPGRVEIWASANLWKDGIRIYHIKTIGICIQEQA